MLKSEELKAKRAELETEMRTLHDKGETEDRDLTEVEYGRFKELQEERDALARRIERAEALEKAERRAPAKVHRAGDGAFEERAREFRITRAIGALIGAPVDDGLERELSKEVRSRNPGREFEGIAVPDQVFEARAPITAAGEAADLIQTQHLAGRYIDKLRNALVVERLGATVLPNLVGNVDIPKANASATGYWVGEDGSIAESTPTFSDVNMTPKTVGARTSYTRRTLLNATPAIEDILRNDLTAVVARAIDAAALMGPGSSNQPAGIIATAGVHEVDMSAPDWAAVLQHCANVEAANAAGGSLAWVMNAHAAKKLRTTMKDPAFTSGDYLMMEPGRLAGYAAAVTNALPGDPAAAIAEPATLIFGNWSDLLIGYWSGVDLLVNPYESTAYEKGRVLIRAMRDVDVAVRHAEAFSFSNNLPVAA